MVADEFDALVGAVIAVLSGGTKKKKVNKLYNQRAAEEDSRKRAATPATVEFKVLIADKQLASRLLNVLTGLADTNRPKVTNAKRKEVTRAKSIVG